MMTPKEWLGKHTMTDDDARLTWSTLATVGGVVGFLLAVISAIFSR